MRAHWPGYRTLANVGAWLTLLAIGLLLPAPTQADCSHRADRPAIDLDRAPASGRDELAAAIRPVEPIPAPQPCTGPQCSGKSAPTPATVAPPAPPVVEWALAPRPPLGLRLAGAFTPDETVPLDPLALASSIFHPPRRSR